MEVSQTLQMILLWHAWKGEFRDSSGALNTRSRASAAHYCAHLVCVCAGDPSFITSSLVIPADIGTVLTAQHQKLLLLEFGLQICAPPY